MAINDNHSPGNPSWPITMIAPATTGTTATVTTVPVTFVQPGCSCGYTWAMGASGAMESVRRPSPACPQHSDPSAAAGDGPCPTCGR